jgi:hypothetical protein
MVSCKVVRRVQHRVDNARRVWEPEQTDMAAIRHMTVGTPETKPETRYGSWNALRVAYVHAAVQVDKQR